MNHKMVVCILCLFIALPVFASKTVSVKSEGMTLKLEQVVDGLGVVWSMCFISQDLLLLTERSGSIKRIDVNSGAVTQLKNVPVVLSQGQGGMLDIALSPNFKKDSWIYVTYVKDVDIDTEGATVLARAKLVKDAFVDWQELLVTKSDTDETYHFGSRIAFDAEGHVFFGVGDRGVRDNAQDLTNHAGSIMRLNLDGSVPADNPYSKNKNWLPEVWSIGHRNPQGMAYDLENQRLWSIEHGPRGGDEINLIKPGANYGWPVISYGKEYWGPFDVGEGTHREGMEQPVKVYTPS